MQQLILIKIITKKIIVIYLNSMLKRKYILIISNFNNSLFDLIPIYLNPTYINICQIN